MKITTSIVACVAVLSGNVTAKQNDNIVVNPGFENSGLNWDYWFANIKDAPNYDGALHGRIAKGTQHNISQTITIPKTGYYDLSAYVISPSDDATLAITNLHGRILAREPIKISERYKRNAIKNVAFEQGEHIVIQFTGSALGGVHIDNVSFSLSNKPLANTLNQIIDFSVAGQSESSDIDKLNRIVEIHVPYDTDVTTLTIDNLLVSNGSRTSIQQGEVIDLSTPKTVQIVSSTGEIANWTLSAIRKDKQVVVTSSNKELEQSFQWAIDKTRHFVMTGKHDLVNRDEFNNDGSGSADYIPSYWAGYFDRTAFYSRDFLHQTSGASIAGLNRENFSMFKTFAKHATESRKWYTLWAVNFDGTPHTIDYKDDNWFVREVPAQFEFVEKAWKQYLWTGDKRYIEDSDLWQFYSKVLTDYITLHDNQAPNGIAEGYGGIFEGSATYNERGEFPIEAGDGIASQYQANLAYAEMLDARSDYEQAKYWRDKASKLKTYFNQVWSLIDPSNPLSNYVNIVQKDGLRLNDFGKENSWFIPMKLITEPSERNDRYLDFIADNLGNGIGTTPEAPSNIEAYTYIPETYFPYNRNEEAWKWMQYIMNNKDQPHERPTQGTNGNYPEISFTFVSNTIEGLMGIKPNASKHHIITASHLTPDISWIEAKHLMMGEQERSIRHDGLSQTTLINQSQNPVTWEAWFYGDYSTLYVDGNAINSQQKIINGQRVSFITVTVYGGETRQIHR